MRRFRKSSKIIFVLILLVCFISIGYSFLETSLSIGGSVDVIGIPTLTTDDLINKANPVNKDYNTSTNTEKAEMYTFSHPRTSQVARKTVYRYIGNQPNNYMFFNNEMWRIIGVFDGRIKIIKETSLVSSSWDNKGISDGAETDNGQNDWTKSRLMKILNPGYENDSVGGSLYYNRVAGNCFSGPGNNTQTCDFSKNGLNDKARSKIDTVTWYLGGHDNPVGVGGSDYYSYERGTRKYGAAPTNWNGNVGLMYPSDYIYTFANGVDNTCFTDAYNCLNPNSNSSWLFSGEMEWLLTPYVVSDYYNFLINPQGRVTYSYSNYILSIRPTVYLKTNVVLVGNGTSTSPYMVK